VPSRVIVEHHSRLADKEPSHLLVFVAAEGAAAATAHLGWDYSTACHLELDEAAPAAAADVHFPSIK
jgi:hypothetical protein